MLVNKTVLYASEVASLLGYSTHTVYRLIHCGKIPAYKEEGCRAWHIPESSVLAYIDSRLKQFNSYVLK